VRRFSGIENGVFSYAFILTFGDDGFNDFKLLFRKS
jgi:hypothetical protein